MPAPNFEAVREFRSNPQGKTLDFLLNRPEGVECDPLLRQLLGLSPSSDIPKTPLMVRATYVSYWEIKDPRPRGHLPARESYLLQIETGHGIFLVSLDSDKGGFIFSLFD